MSVERADILKASLALLEDEGLEALTMRRIAEAVGRMQPAVYARFAGKDDLLAAIAIEGFAVLADLLEAAERRPEPLAAVAAAYVGFAEKRPRLYDLMFTDPIAISFGSGASTPQPLQRSFAAIARAVRARVALAGRTELDSGGLELITETVWASLHGLVVLSAHRRLRSGPKLQRARIAAVVRAVCGG